MVHGESSPGSRLRWFLGTSILFIAIGVAQGVLLYQAMAAEGGMRHSAARLVGWQTLIWGAWALLTPIIWEIVQRWPIGARDRTRTLIANGAGIVLIVVIHLFLMAVATRLVPPMPWARTESLLDGFRANLQNRSIFDGFVCLGMFAVMNWAREHERSRARSIATARLETELARAELHALQLQIHPHFLFNALHSIAGLVREHRGPEAVDAIASLSDLLRYVLDNGQRQEVTLEQELDFIERYLDVQRARFGDRLSVAIDVDRDLMGEMVPSLILQPVVENAVSHGISKRPEGGRIDISAGRDEGKLRLSVVNDGPPLASGETEASRIGLENTRERIRLLYGSSGSLEVRNVDRGVSAILWIPIRENDR